jgi:hypothetical protein
MATAEDVVMVPVPKSRLMEVYQLLAQQQVPPRETEERANDSLARLVSESSEYARALLSLLAVEAVDSPLPFEEAASKLGFNGPFLGGVVGGMQTKFGREAVPFERVTVQGRKAFRIDAETAARLRELLGPQVGER